MPKSVPATTRAGRSRIHAKRGNPAAQVNRDGSVGQTRAISEAIDGRGPGRAGRGPASRYRAQSRHGVVLLVEPIELELPV